MYYLPAFLALACPFLSFVFVKIRDNILHECEVRLVDERRKDLADNIETETKFYHNICPACGTKYAASIAHCLNCGSVLEVVEGDRRK